MFYIFIHEYIPVGVQVRGVNNIFPITWGVPPQRSFWIGLHSMTTIEVNIRVPAIIACVNLKISERIFGRS
jgi:hypothetical protein